ncbi:MAG: Maf family protein [Vagococcus sp.]
MEIVLASSSPRRKELLTMIQSDFTVHPADIDETVLPGQTPLEYVEKMAKEKAEALVENYPTSIIIGCDTSVIHNGCIMGKPKDTQEAKHMLNALSGDTHEVLTSVCIITPEKTYRHTEHVDVTFYPLSDCDIETYLSTGEHVDKAGSYGIQGKGALFVKAIEGDYYSIVGFPVGYVNQILTKK